MSSGGHPVQGGWANQSVITPEKASYRESVATCNVKLAGFRLERFCHALENTINFHQIFFRLVPSFCIVTISFQISLDLKTSVALSATLLLNISMPGDRIFCIFRSNANYMNLPSFAARDYPQFHSFDSLLLCNVNLLLGKFHER